MKRLAIVASLILLGVAVLTRQSDDVKPPCAQTPSISATPSPPATNSGQWTSLCGPYERVAFALAIDPEKGTMYAGTWGHGLYTSTDRGQNWQPLNNANSSLRLVKALATVPPTSTLLIGTYAQGLWRLQGNAWQQLGLTGPFSEPNDKDHPNRRKRFIESLLVVSGTQSEMIYAGTWDGIWASAATEDNWKLLDNGFANDDNAYHVGALASGSAGTLFAGTSLGLYYSHNGGEAWEFIGPQAGCPNSPGCNISSLAIVTATNNPSGTLLIGTYDTGVFTLDLSQKDIQSQTWLTRTTGFDTNPGSKTIQTLLSTDGVSYAGAVDVGVHVSTDGGVTWEQHKEGLLPQALSVLSLAYDLNTRTLYAGTYGDGVYAWHVGSSKWETANGQLPVDFPVQRMAFAGNGFQHLIAGLQVGGLYLYDQENEPLGWRHLGNALPIGLARDVGGLAVGGSDQNIVTVAAGIGIFRSTDAGLKWSRVTDGLPAGNLQAKTLAQGRRNLQVLYALMAGGDGVYRSENSGERWQSVKGDLPLGLVGQLTSLTVGADDQTVYLSSKTGISVTHDAGLHWGNLATITTTSDIVELAWSERSPSEVFLLGGYPHTLYVRTSDGIYTTHGEEDQLQLRLRGAFNAIQPDPYRPNIVYVGSQPTVVKVDFSPFTGLVPQTNTAGPDLWISDDEGDTWTWGGISPGSITSFAVDPNNHEHLYSGTDGNGVHIYALPSIAQSFSSRAIALAIGSVLLAALVVAGLGITNSGRRIAGPYRIRRPTRWFALGLLRLRHSDELGLINTTPTPLRPLERLVLSQAPTTSFGSDNIYQLLEEIDMPTTAAQIDETLNRLAGYHLLIRKDHVFRVTHPLLREIARKRFWEDTTERAKLVEEVYRESRLRGDVRRFFQLAEFAVSPEGSGLKVTSTQPEYELLNARRGIYVDLHIGAALTDTDFDEIQSNVSRAYDGRVGGAVAFFIVNGPFQSSAYQRLITLRQDAQLYLIPLVYSEIRRSVDAASAYEILSDSMRRALGHADLFQINQPIQNSLDFFDHLSDLNEVISACRTGHIIGLAGLGGIGKTTLARQALNHLPDNALIAWLDLKTPQDSDLYTTLRQAWFTHAQRIFPAWEQPGLAPLPDQPTVVQLRTDLTAILDSLPGEAPSKLLIAVFDGLSDSLSGTSEMQPLLEAMQSTERCSVIGAYQTWPRQVNSYEVRFIRPFEFAASAEMINSLAVQMEITFEVAAVEQLYQAAGGHPLMMRELAHTSIAQLRGSVRPVTTTDVENAITKYISQPATALNRLWESLTIEEKTLVQAAASGKLAEIIAAPTALADAGLLIKLNDHWQLFSQAFDRWLKIEPRS